MPSTPAPSTLLTSPGSEAAVSDTTKSTMPAMMTDRASSLPILASGFSTQDSQVISRSSNNQSRNSSSRNMPPKAAICGCAAASRPA